MSLVRVDRLALALGGKTLFEDLNFDIDAGDRIGLVGPNGSGKSSLMRVLSAQMTPDAGSIVVSQDVRVGYLSQDVQAMGEHSALDHVLQSVPERNRLKEEVDVIQTQLDALSSDPDAYDKVMALSVQIAEKTERLAMYEQDYSEHQAKGILAGLGFTEAQWLAPATSLSGGWRMRVVLASLLFQRPDVLLLDEPTNHLDMPSVLWFSQFLQSYAGAFVLISHDREFLNEQINRVICYEPEGVNMFRGNLDAYAQQREEHAIYLQQRAQNLARERQHHEDFIKRFRAKASKASAVQSRVRALEKMEEVKLTTNHAGQLHFRFPPCQRSGQEVLRVDDVHHRYDTDDVLRGVTLRAQRNARICLMGVNGSGKSTLLRIMAGELSPTQGSVQEGHQVRIGYYAQHHLDTLDASGNVLDQVKQKSENAGLTQLRAALGALGLGEEHIDKPIKVLSGGERARVALACLLVQPSNVLLMDEPTNHLDLQSSESLAHALREYPGTLIFVSHNRSFVRTLATQIWYAEGHRIEAYPGTFDEFVQWQRAQHSARDAASADTNASASKQHNASSSKSKSRSRRVQQEIQKLAKRVATLELEIASLEEAQRSHSDALSDPEHCADEAKRKESTEALNAVNKQLDETMQAWTQAQQQLEVRQAE